MRERLVHAAKLMAAKALVNPLTGRLVGRVFRDRISARGLLVNTRSALVRPEVKALIALGMYESAECRLVRQFLRSDLPVVEFGASIGYITGQIARRHPPRQIAVEANPFLLPLIEDLLQLNEFEGVRLIFGAIDYSGRDVTEFCVHSSNTAGALAGCDTTVHGAVEVQVPALTLHDLLAQEGVEQFALVCDIEGAERGMIMKEGPTVIRRCEQMIIELHAGDYQHSYMSADALASAVEERWGMQAMARDGNNWLFQRNAMLRDVALPKSHVTSQASPIP
jgi:FkbM family methyltransferase